MDNGANGLISGYLVNRRLLTILCLKTAKDALDQSSISTTATPTHPHSQGIGAEQATDAMSALLADHNGERRRWHANRHDGTTQIKRPLKSIV